MLIRYKKNFEKIAMGLLSFMPEAKNIKKLQEIIKKYESDDNWNLHLWKEDDDILGAIGIRIENGLNAVIQHISVNPSHRGMGIAKNMVREAHKQYQNKYAVCATEETKEFYENALENDSEGK